MRLFDSDYHVMEVLWEKGDIRAGEVSKILEKKIGWNKNTTYTIIKRLIQKGAIRRTDPGFVCTALISKEMVRQTEATALVNKLFDGSPNVFLSAFLDGKEISNDEIDRLKKLIEGLK